MSKNDGLQVGRFSSAEEEFIRQHYKVMTDVEIGKVLNRKAKSIQNKRVKMGINDKNERSEIDSEEMRNKYLSSMDGDDRSNFYRKELRSTSMYGKVKKSVTKDELIYFEDKYVEFMMDPSVETMTSMERDAWLRMTIAEIRMLRFIKMETDSLKNSDEKPVSKQNEIAQCQDIIRRCENSLNVERQQRLKNKNDQAITFVSLVRELKDPKIRRMAGEEAAMLKFIAEKHYNDSLGTNIQSGQNAKYSLSAIFKNDNDLDKFNNDKIDFTKPLGDGT